MEPATIRTVAEQRHLDERAAPLVPRSHVPGHPDVGHYASAMAELSKAAVERLLLLLANYGQLLSKAMAEVAPDPEPLNNMSVIVLCSLDVEGPRRPGSCRS